ncbi:amidohydrolase family protein [Sediminispirochaeta smaragdinae]|uniref:Amidohydrolase n=1 Tax=Sediminispirochaeta smaragdinae (strain DSM 11293 / JCM 15392 / SEBR 4228) TaxID=573413 RepID=E1R935_SEDSS|nr:amidohydrolase family protein [Sediminispirochaeta smaragdinae]ADK83004.1 amidohydrolase [Sediminispirochaeta smaragdinae DSM 11293]
MDSYLVRNCDIADVETLSFRRQDILVEGMRIAKIASSIRPTGNETVIDAGAKMLLPGFVDCHSHLLQTFSKGYLDDYPIVDWLVRMYKIEEVMSEEDNYYAVLLGCLEALRFGTTTINEMCGQRYLDSTMQAIDDSGIRATVGLSHTDIPENDVTPLWTVEESLKESEELFHRHHLHLEGRLRTSCAPSGLPACSKELMQQLKGFTRSHGLIFHTHLAEGPVETKKIRECTGWGEAEALYNYGVLDRDTLLAHSIWLEDDELGLIKESGAHPVYCPSTNLKISDGIPKVDAMLKMGIPVCLGCDGEASSSNRDMVLEARIGAYLQKGASLDPSSMDLSTTYAMMTRCGAEALKYSDLGVIREGALADFILVDTRGNLALSNQNTRLSNFLYAGSGSDVDTVFVNGRLLVHGKNFLSFDIQEILEKCETLLSGLDEKIRGI